MKYTLRRSLSLRLTAEGFLWKISTRKKLKSNKTHRLICFVIKWGMPAARWQRNIILPFQNRGRIFWRISLKGCNESGNEIASPRSDTAPWCSYSACTYGTRFAEQNTPARLLCNQMGHAGSKVTEKHYLAVSKQGEEIIKIKLENIWESTN